MSEKAVVVWVYDAGKPRIRKVFGTVDEFIMKHKVSDILPLNPDHLELSIDDLVKFYPLPQNWNERL